MKKNKNLLYITGSLLLFLILGFLYAYPVLDGKALFQHDIIQYRGGAEELLNYREEQNQETYWSNSMFGGMPTYQMGAQFPGDVIKSLDRLLLILPKPVNYLFLLCSGFFLLGMAALRNWKYALLGSVFFGFCTYFFIITAAGHNGKIHTIAYFAPLLAGIIYTYYRRMYIPGFIITTLAMALQLSANHPQMTYYLFMALGIFFISELVRAIRGGISWKHFGIATAITGLAFLLGIGMNAQRLMANAEYVKETVRGEKILSDNKETKADGMDRESILTWSYGKLETLNLMIPRLMGGSSSEPEFNNNIEKIQYWVQENVQSQEQMDRISQGLGSLSYWGEQPGTSGPAYQGALVIFLGILGIFFAQRKYKYWLLAAIVLSVFLAWGSNMQWLSDFFIDYVPFYNKFRAPSSILVVVELLIPLAAIIGVYRLLELSDLSFEYKKKHLLLISGICIGALILLTLFKNQLLPFSTETERQFLPEGMLEILISERQAVFTTDAIRAIIMCAIGAGVLLLGISHKIKKEWALLALGIIALGDLWSVNKRYLNDDNFIRAGIAEQPFQTERSDYLIAQMEKNPELQSILESAPINAVLQQLQNTDKSQYRVFNPMISPFNETNTSYYSQSIGGYHAVKLRRYDDVINYYFFPKDSAAAQYPTEVLNMLNTKYILGGSPDAPKIMQNPNANGNAWFVHNIITVPTANDEIATIGKVNTRESAVILDKELVKLQRKTLAPKAADANIKLTKYQPNALTYQSSNPNPGLAVFSEIYYPHGWEARIDGKPAEILRVNYLLRALEVPAGNHLITFTFEPKILSTGKTVSYASTAAFVVLGAAAIFWDRKRRRKDENPEA